MGLVCRLGAQTRVAEECDTTVTAARTVLIAYSIQDYILANDKKGRRPSSVPRNCEPIHVGLNEGGGECSSFIHKMMR